MTSFTLGELAARVGGEVAGDPGRRLSGLKPLAEAGGDDLSFYHNRRYLGEARASRAGALLVADPAGFPGRDLLVCREVYPAFATLLELFHPAMPPAPGVHPSAVVAASARLGAGVSVGPCAVVGERAAIGDGAIVGAHAVLGDDAEVGPATLLHPHVVMAGQSGAAGHLRLGDGTMVTAQAAVMADTKPGEMVSGSPARPQKEWDKALANLLQRDALRRRVRELERAVGRLGGEK
jgi:UDP-3-O-[3-hydroxymyristoyl] glucosamine N-acyltransferase